jgi:lauroyl/myristoyl acyltransferase
MKKAIAAVLRQDPNSPEVRKDARHGMRNFCKSVVDILRYAYKETVFERDIDLIGTENVDRTLAEGKGAIIIGFHMGNLDLGIRALAYAGYPVNAIVQSLDSRGLNGFVQKPRAHSGLKLVTAASGILYMIGVLRRNEIMAMMIDNPHNDKGITVKLGEKTISVPAGMAAMALRTGAKILPCGTVRSTNTKFHGIIGKPILFDPSGDLAEDARELTQRAVHALEEMARIFADQWYIFHPLIKDYGTGMNKEYSNSVSRRT